MTFIDFESLDLNNPVDRRTILEHIPPDRESARTFHRKLLEIFRLEMALRKAEAPDEEDYFENIYWCALLLYLIGDPADVPLMWEAKHLNMDTACGFDEQFLVGAGLDETIKYLETHGDARIVDSVKRLRDSPEFQNLQQWEDFRIGYFYPK